MVPTKNKSANARVIPQHICWQELKVLRRDIKGIELPIIGRKIVSENDQT